MEDISLIDTRSRSYVFRQGVLTSLNYWHTWLEDKVADSAAVDRERNIIVRAISFALDLEGLAWPSARALVEGFSPYMERRGHWGMWDHILRRAVTVAEGVGDHAGAVSLSVLLARLLFLQSRYSEAITAYRQTIRLARQIGDRFNQARAYTNLGYYYTERSQWSRAKVLCCGALIIFEQIDSDHGRAHTDNHLGILYTRLHQWDKALKHLDRACARWLAMGDEHGLMRGFLNLGNLYLSSKRSDDALVYLEKALHLAELTGDETTRGRIYLNMGLALMIGENLAQAEMYVQQAETIFRQYADIAELARAWDSLAGIYFRRGKCAEAILLAEDALKVWRRLKNIEDEINTLLDLFEYELAKGNRPQAARLLNEVEYLIGPQEHTLYGHHLPRLVEMRRSLTGETH